MKIIKEYKVPIYKSNLIVLITNKVSVARTYSKSLPDSYVYANVVDMKNTDGTHRVVVVLNPKNKTSKITHGVIAHEALHATQFILQDAGVDYGELGESYAYLMEWIVGKIYKTLGNIKIGNKL